MMSEQKDAGQKTERKDGNSGQKGNAPFDASKKNENDQKEQKRKGDDKNQETRMK